MGGILLVLALMGGNWGTDFSVSANGIQVDNPYISYVVPSVIKVGSPDTVVIIGGSNFGDMDDTRVRITGGVLDEMLEPKYIAKTGLSINITNTLMVEPITYVLTVFRSEPNHHTVPTIPIWPGVDLPSNPVNLTVYEPIPVYLPIIKR